MPSTREVNVKIAFARETGDEAGHFQLVSGRLAALGVDIAAFQPPADNLLLAYLKSLPTTVERVAAGLFTLKSIAYVVNETFMARPAAAWRSASPPRPTGRTRRRWGGCWSRSPA